MNSCDLKDTLGPFGRTVRITGAPGRMCGLSGIPGRSGAGAEEGAGATETGDAAVFITGAGSLGVWTGRTVAAGRGEETGEWGVGAAAARWAFTGVP